VNNINEDNLSEFFESSDGDYYCFTYSTYWHDTTTGKNYRHTSGEIDGDPEVGGSMRSWYDDGEHFALTSWKNSRRKKSQR
jgi:hypothetical protein